MHTVMSSLKFLTVAMILLCQWACALDKNETSSGGKEAYINAHLGFAISYPEPWASYLLDNGDSPYTDYIARWSFAPADAAGTSVSMVVISIPRDELFPPDDMTTILQDRHPNLTVTDHEKTIVPAGEAFEIHGYTPQKRFLAWIIHGRERFFLVECSASPGIYADYAPQFKDIIRSFELLE